MHYIYHTPTTVIHPERFINKVDVLYDGGADGFSLAMIEWEGLPHIAMRWNVAAKEQDDAEKQMGRAICSGSPSLNGKPS